MRTSMMSHPNSLFGSSVKAIRAALLSAGLLVAATGQAAESALPSKPQPQSESSQTVQPQVDKQAVDAAAEKRKKLLAEAEAAISQTQQALKALDDKKSDDAIKALADATGKLELIVSRDPALALAPVSTTVVSYDLFASQDAIRAAIGEAKRELADGKSRSPRAGRGVGQRDPDTHHKHPVGDVSGGDQGYHAADRRRQDRRGESAASGGARNPRHYHRGDSIAHDTGREPAQ